jgi:type IV secretion system protein VirB2
VRPFNGTKGDTGCARIGAVSVLMATPACVVAQDVFLQGVSSFQASIYTWLTPLAIIAVMVLGLFALAGRITWGTGLMVLAGIAIAFGAPQLVTWARGLAGV